jgi:molecular chaperone GrpE
MRFARFQAPDQEPYESIEPMTRKEFDESAPVQDAPGAEPLGRAGSGNLPAEPADQAVLRLEGQLREAQERHLRLAAEFDNFRKRVARERIELTDRAQAALVMKLLDILDDLDRVAASDPATPPAALLEATALVDKKLRKELEAAGLERIDPAGQPFDPSIHEAVSALTPPSPDKDHIVSATFAVGYRFKGNLVRPARVQVYSSGGDA